MTRRITNNEPIPRSINQILAVVCRQCILVDLVDHLIDLDLDEATIAIRIRIVGGVDCLFLQCLEDLDGGLHGALCCTQKCGTVLCILIILIEGTHLHAHPLGDRHPRGVVTGTVDLHARRDLLQAL